MKDRARHTEVTKLKKIETFEDFRKILTRTHGDAWRNATTTEVKDCFGLPKRYPCYLQVVTEYESEPDWGDGKETVFHFYYV